MNELTIGNGNAVVASPQYKPKTNRRGWSEREVERAIELRAAGYSNEQAAAQLNTDFHNGDPIRSNTKLVSLWTRIRSGDVHIPSNIPKRTLDMSDIMKSRNGYTGAKKVIADIAAHSAPPDPQSLVVVPTTVQKTRVTLDNGEKTVTLYVSMALKDLVLTLL